MSHEIAIQRRRRRSSAAACCKAPRRCRWPACRRSAQAQSFPTAKVNTTKLAVTDTEVTVGQLHSATGTMAISETGSIQAEQLAIDQINAMGGILGRKIKVIKEDGASDWPTFAEKAQEAARQRPRRGRLRLLDLARRARRCCRSSRRKTACCTTRPSTKAWSRSKNVIYTGQEATQQIIWGLDWAHKEKKAKTLLPHRLATTSGRARR